MCPFGCHKLLDVCFLYEMWPVQTFPKEWGQCISQVFASDSALCQWGHQSYTWQDTAAGCSLEVWVSLHELLCSQPCWGDWYTFYTETQKVLTLLHLAVKKNRGYYWWKCPRTGSWCPHRWGTLLQVPKWIYHKISLTFIDLHQCSVMWFRVGFFPKKIKQESLVETAYDS